MGKRKPKKEKAVSQVKIDQAKLNIKPMPTAAPRVKAFEDAIDEQLAGDYPGAVISRGSGRPAKETAPGSAGAAAQPTADIPIKMVEGICELPFALWAAQTGVKALELKPEETEILSQPAKEVIDILAPRLDPRYLAVGSLVVAAGIIVMGKLRILALLREKRKQERPGDKVAAGPVVQPGTGKPADGFPKMNEVKPEHL